MKDNNSIRLTSFTIDFSKVSEDAADTLAKNQENLQSTTMSSILDINQQSDLFTDPAFAEKVSNREPTEDKETREARNSSTPGSIYAKADFIRNPDKILTVEQEDEPDIKITKKQAIARSYKEQSDKDTARWEKIHLVIDKTEEILVLGLNTTMDGLVDALQDKGISVSNDQRNFLRTQYNQMGITGIPGTLFETSKPQGASIVTAKEALEEFKPKNTFIINNGKLDTVSYSSTAITYSQTGLSADRKDLTNKDHIKNSGTFTVTADIKNLQGGESQKSSELKLTDDDWLPKNKADKISLSYKSKNGLTMDLNKEVAKTLGKGLTNAKKPKTILNAPKRAISSTKRKLGRFTEFMKKQASTAFTSITHRSKSVDSTKPNSR